MEPMRGFLAVLTGLILLAVVVVLLAGTIGMAAGVDPRRSNKLMQWRVILQASAILLVVIMISLLRS
jgi:hypothetical protein